MTKSSLVAVLALAMTAGIAGFHHQRAVAEEACGEFGTSVTFADSPIAAAKQALKEEKLVFVLHVSGLFEESDFT